MANKKSVSIKARVTIKLFQLVDDSMYCHGFSNMSEYIRMALINQIAKDTGKSVSEITKMVQS